MPEDRYTKIRQECWDKSLDADAVGYIYQGKSKALEKWVTWTKVLGFLVPITLGGLVTSYAQDSNVMKWAIIIAAPIAVAQLALSTILTVSNVENNLIRYTEIATENRLLKEDFLQIAKFPPLDLETFESRFNVLVERERGILKSDEMSEKEKRKGMRHGLRNARRACAGCDQTPISMIPTNCDVCGNFN